MVDFRPNHTGLPEQSTIIVSFHLYMSKRCSLAGRTTLSSVLGKCCSVTPFIFVCFMYFQVFPYYITVKKSNKYMKRNSFKLELVYVSIFFLLLIYFYIKMFSSEVIYSIHNGFLTWVSLNETKFEMILEKSKIIV